MTDRDLPTRTEGEAETFDMPEGLGAFQKGQVLGERYQILEMLGRGGMGEVWQAFDLKLRVEVALKALRSDLFKSERRLELLRQEVRAAREVMSPNVCRIFDLIEIEGRELVSMEYVDGATLLGVLQERGPLDLKEAQDIASQFLAGLEAIHNVGLVHRDIKPENIMLTRAGRVVVMDFGLAREDTEGGGSVSGTPAYMAPEQASGQQLDARADVYAAGVVLAEMVSPDGIKSHDSRQSVWEGVRSEPIKVPESPWAPVVKRAVAKDREGRFNTARTLTRALEDVTLRVEGADDLHPYPGLASFTQEDAEYFFGREAEVEQMWRKLEGPPRMLALVGPSGAGKSSFIRAGLFATAPASWSFLVATPGNAAISSLGRVIAREMAGDPDMVEKMMDFDDPDVSVEVLSRWQAQNDNALLVVDQFEELFTQNSPEEQKRFAELLHRLVLEADVHVVLSMRDDFLMRCRDFEPLEPTFADMTALPSLSGSALRRALTRPATKCGYRFEDDALAEEMLAEVEGERGALPLLAFAAAQLWERRDREAGLLTREAYQEIGGVGGSLASHAEATIDRIGTERITLVRELFRNLVTAEGTRAVREWSELLSVFDPTGVSRAGINPAPTMGSATTVNTNVGEGFIPSRDAASEVLRELINARLLTSYEVREDEREPTRQVEIIHESLLANWPRLVRWQTQDADASQLRDQLRQAAKTWDDQGRTDDTLWTGAAYREFASWRERYPGGLTETEEAFAAAMTSLATRRRRRRRIAVAAGFSVMLTMLAVVGTLWQRSVRETRRAEAQKLLALGELALGADPTEAFAWARASLELADSREARLFVNRVLAKGPVARALLLGGELGTAHDVVFSPNGEWVALRDFDKLKVYRRTGGGPSFMDTFPTAGAATIWPSFDPSSRYLRAYKAGEIRTYSIPDFEETARHEIPRPAGYPFQTDRGVFNFLTQRFQGAITRWEPGSPPELVTTTPPLGWPFIWTAIINRTGEWAAYAWPGKNRHVYLRSLVDLDVEPRLFYENDEPISNILLHPELEWIGIRGKESPTIKVLSVGGNEGAPLAVLEGRGLPWMYNDDRRIVEGGLVDGKPTAYVWDVGMPAGADPLALRWRYFSESLNGVAMDPGGRWVAAGTIGVVPFWPLPDVPTISFPSLGEAVSWTPDGQKLIGSAPGFDGGIRVQPISGGGQFRTLANGEMFFGVAVDPHERFVAAIGEGKVMLVPLDGSEPMSLKGHDPTMGFGAVAFDPLRQRVAAGVFKGAAAQKVIGVWDLKDGTYRELGPADDAGDGVGGGYQKLVFAPDGTLLSQALVGRVRRWNVEDGSSMMLVEGLCGIFGLRPNSNSVIVGCMGAEGQAGLMSIDLNSGDAIDLETFKFPSNSRPSELKLSPQGNALAVGFEDGTVAVATLKGGDPHVLLGHDSRISGLEFSPDGRFLASAGMGGRVRVWPVPDLSKPPLYALPRAELLAKLDTHTNVRMVRDEGSPNGWTIEIGPFPGWADMPEW